MPDNSLGPDAIGEGPTTPQLVADLIGRLRRNQGPLEHNGWGGGVLLIGAGCSVTAGIPAALGVVDIALRLLARRMLRLDHAEAEALDGSTAYARLQADDVTFDQPYGPDLYYEIFDRWLDEATEQRAVVLAAIRQGGRRINWAHLRLGQLVAARCFHTVLTTNFDQLSLEAIVRCGVFPAVADGLEALNRVDPRPETPQLVHVHGSLHNYTLRNSKRHVAEVGKAPAVQSAIARLLREAPFLLVVGYRGEEEGLMVPLRLALGDLRGKPVFWALRGDTPGAELQQLMRDHDAVRLLRGQDADALFDSLATGAKQGEPVWMADPVRMLMHEAGRIVPPGPGTPASRLLEHHRAELETLDRCLTASRESPEAAEELSPQLDDLLLKGSLQDARRLLEAAGQKATAEEWMRFGIAAAHAVTERYLLPAAEEVDIALLHAERSAGPAPLGTNRLWSMGDALHLAGKLESADRAFHRMRDEARAAGEPGLRDLSVALNRVADVARDRGDLDAAEAAYRESLDIARSLACALGTPGAQRDLAVALNKVARIARDRGDLDAAEAAYRESLDIARSLARALGTPEAQRDLSVPLDNVAGIARGRGDLDAAEAAYRESLEIRRSLARALGTPEAQRDLSVALNKVAGIARDRGDLDAAEAGYRESLEIRRSLARALGTPGAQRDLSVSLNNVAGIARNRGDLDAAEAGYRESLEIRRSLARALGTPGAQRDLSVSLNNVAGIARNRGDLDAAEAGYRESLEIRRSLARALGTPEAQRDLSVSLDNVAGIAEAQGDKDGAAKLLRDAVAAAEEFARQRPVSDAEKIIASLREKLRKLKA